MSPLLQSLFSDFVTIFVVVDPVGTLPIFVVAAAGLQAAQRRRMAAYASAIAFGVLLFFIVAGQLLLQALHVRILSFQLAGSIMLFLFAVSLVFGIRLGPDYFDQAPSDASRAVFPLAIPGIAGPGAMLAVVVLTDNDRFSIPEQAQTTGMLALVMVVTLLALLVSDRIIRVIGEGGTNVVSRVMGLILASIAIDNGITAVEALARMG